MHKKERESKYEFNNDQKREVRARAMGFCEFPARRCFLPNTNRVNHLSGVGIAKRDNLEPNVISDVSLNALMLCVFHSYLLDVEEQYQLACLDYEQGRRTKTDTGLFGTS